MKVLIIGYGSIGKRHTKILTKIKKISILKVLTKQKLRNIQTISKKNEIIDFDPDYVVIANETHLHFNYIDFFEKNFEGIKILVEKPLFNKFINYKVNNNKIYVGYNLRFHPFLLIIKELIYKKVLWSVNITAGSYLPNWRKLQNYKTSYSSKKKSGGVLLDLSHEIDYTLWFLGKIKPLFSIYNKISDLDIQSNDNLNLIATNKNKTIIQMHLNYFFKEPVRQILIDGKNISINADLINNKLIINQNKKIKKISLKKFDLDNMYMNQHKEIIDNEIKNICSYNEALNVMSTINKIIKIKK